MHEIGKMNNLKTLCENINKVRRIVNKLCINNENCNAVLLVFYIYLVRLYYNEMVENTYNIYT